MNRDGVDTDHEFVVGVRGNLMGHMDAMEEGDVDMTQEAALNVGAAYSGGTLTTAGTEVKLQRISADVNFKSNGLSANAEFFWADIDPDIDGSESTSPVGGYAQVGYMLNENLELAGRWSMIDCDNATGAVVTDDTAVACVGDNTQEWSASVNYYWWKHHMKAQFGFTREILDSGADTNDIDTNKWVFQLSAYV